MAIEFEYMDHVAIRVKDLAVSAEWYQRILGFEVQYKWENAWLVSRGATRVGLAAGCAQVMMTRRARS